MKKYTTLLVIALIGVAGTFFFFFYRMGTHDAKGWKISAFVYPGVHDLEANTAGHDKVYEIDSLWSRFTGYTFRRFNSC